MSGLWARPADSTLKKTLVKMSSDEPRPAKPLSASETAEAQELFPALMGPGCFYLMSPSVD